MSQSNDLLHSHHLDVLLFVIDRLETNQTFQNSVVGIFKSVFGDDIEFNTYDRTLDQDEQIRDMGDELRNHLGSPVITFHKRITGTPTVFWLVAKRGEQLGES